MRLNPLPLLHVEADGSAAVFDPQTNHVMTLNPIGVFIWHLLEKDADDDTIAAEIVKTFDVERSIAEKDLQRFLSALADHGLLFTEK